MRATEVDFAYLRNIVFDHSANVLDPSRDYLFEARLHRLLCSHGIGSLDRLVSTLKMQPDAPLHRAVAEAMTVNETSFFRDHRSFDLLREDLLPKLIEKRRALRRLRLWSAACSSGQEAYSLAMMISENFPLLTDWQIDIFGTDLKAEMVERAQAALYQRIEINRGLPARYLLKYFRQEDDQWRVAASLRAMCRFQQRNLCAERVLFERYDGILLRNVMLYFSDETRRRLLTQLHSSIAPDGFLILGSSEQALMPELWQPVLDHKSCYYRPVNAF